MLADITKLIEADEPGTEFAHLKQTSYSAHGQSYIIHVCYLPVTKQYRSYVFRGGSFVAWVLDPELNHSAAPKSLDGVVGIEKLIADTIDEIEENNHNIYANGLGNV